MKLHFISFLWYYCFWRARNYSAVAVISLAGNQLSQCCVRFVRGLKVNHMRGRQFSQSIFTGVLYVVNKYLQSVRSISRTGLRWVDITRNYDKVIHQWNKPMSPLQHLLTAALRRKWYFVQKAMYRNWIMDKSRGYHLWYRSKLS